MLRCDSASLDFRADLKLLFVLLDVLLLLHLLLMPGATLTMRVFKTNFTKIPLACVGVREPGSLKVRVTSAFTDMDLAPTLGR